MMEQSPNTYHGFAEFSRKYSENWRSISKQEKAKYEALAKLDKAQYREEMTNYTGKKRKRKERCKCTSEAPSSFLLFSRDHFAQLRQENPNWVMLDVAKCVGKMWSMSVNVDKIPYEQNAALMCGQSTSRSRRPTTTNVRATMSGQEEELLGIVQEQFEAIKPHSTGFLALGFCICRLSLDALL
ncbi:high mobility group protein B4-like [Rattus norvegicus]|uniref:high mobility group protein B4-like n=1 Tax=Rattus norvegicus TaxID=10116 RepID=UPI001916F02F|nr:high mobility group protein B4-like [Rattus norvegicus]